MRRALQTLIGIACFACMTLVYAAPGSPRVWVALGELGGPYAEAAAVLQAELGNKAELSTAVWGAFTANNGAPPELVITVGASAFEGMLKTLAARGPDWGRVPVLATLLPRATYGELLATGSARSRPTSAAVLDQPLGRQLALIRRALPDRQRVGVLPGAQTRMQLGSLQREAQALGLKLVVAPEIDEPEVIYRSLKTALDDADVILALPDPVVFNGATLQNILLTTYRARVPLVAFSSAYVRAGAVLAVFSTPAQVARRAAEMARQKLAGQDLPPPQAPREFSVSANPKVAASLGLALDDDEKIAADLRRQEAR